MKMTVFWVVAPCSLVKFTDVSDVLAASIIRMISSIRQFGHNLLQTARDQNIHEIQNIKIIEAYTLIAMKK
jgi:hypothetical protein